VIAHRFQNKKNVPDGAKKRDGTKMKTLDRTIGVMATPWVVRVVLVLTFLSMTIGSLFMSEGVTSYVTRFDPDDERARFVKVKVIADQIQARIDANPTAYGPTEYFTDMVTISKEKRYRGVNYISPGSFMFQHYERTEDRRRVFEENLRARRYSNEEIDSARTRILDPHLVAIGDKMAPADLKPIDWLSVGLWFLRAYFMFMPFAFVLYLVWIRVGERTEGKYYGEEEDTEWRRRVNTRLRNFGSLAISLALYPFVLAYVWKKEMSEEMRWYEAEVEFRRTKRKLFTLLSDDELVLVRGWVKRGLSYLEIRKELEACGHTPRHSFATALIATIVVSFAVGFVPKATADESVRDNVSSNASVQSQTGDARAGPDTMRTDGGSFHLALNIPVIPVLIPPDEGRRERVRADESPCAGNTQTVEHVPLFTSAVLVRFHHQLVRRGFASPTGGSHEEVLRVRSACLR